MPEFLLRYKVPSHLVLDHQISRFEKRVKLIALDVQKKISEDFGGLDVVWEAREFSPLTSGMPDLDVTIQVTDNEDKYREDILKFQQNILEILQQHAYEYETVSCWFIRVKGKWSEAKGIRKKESL